MDGQSGAFRQWPRAGGWLDQDQLELDAAQVAFRALRVWRRPAGKRTEGDEEFIEWMGSGWAVDAADVTADKRMIVDDSG